MSALRKTSLGLAAVTALFFLLGGISTAQAQAPSIKGKKVVLLLALAPTPEKDVIEDLQGTVTDVTPLGIELKCEKRTMVTGGRRSGSAYAANLFVPWSSILYVKIL